MAIAKKVEREIATLKSDVAYWKEKALSAACEKGETDTYLSSGAEEPRGLPPGSEVKFRVARGGHMYARVRDGLVEIYCSNGRAVIMPKAANTFYIDVGDRLE